MCNTGQLDKRSAPSAPIRLESGRVRFQCTLSCNVHGHDLADPKHGLFVDSSWPPRARIICRPSDSFKKATPSGRWKSVAKDAPACRLTLEPHAIANRRHNAVAKSAADDRPWRQLLRPPCGWYTSSGANSASGRHARGRLHGDNMRCMLCAPRPPRGARYPEMPISQC